MSNAVNTRLPLLLVDALQPLLPLKTFVETGTRLGDTTLVAAKRFQQVYTIELDEAAYNKARMRLAAHKNVSCLLGDSAQVLPGILPKLGGPSLFWLDAHWSGPGTAKGSTECPLLAEIRAIKQHRHDHVLFIDDARLFFNPPPPPHDPADWPGVAKIVQACTEGFPTTVLFEFEDVLVAMPGLHRVMAWFDMFVNAEETGGKVRTLHRSYGDVLRTCLPAAS